MAISSSEMSEKFGPNVLKTMAVKKIKILGGHLELPDK